MNRISVWNDLLRSPRGAAGEPDDFALARRMRALAVELRIGGRARLRLSQAGLRAARGVCREAESMRRRVCRWRRGAGTAGAGRAADGVVRRAGAAGRRCAACPPRMGARASARVLDALCGAGDLRLTRDRLLLALASFRRRSAAADGRALGRPRGHAHCADARVARRGGDRAGHRARARTGRALGQRRGRRAAGPRTCVLRTRAPAAGRARGTPRAAPRWSGRSQRWTAPRSRPSGARTSSRPWR